MSERVSEDVARQVEIAGQHGTMPDYWREPLVAALDRLEARLAAAEAERDRARTDVLRYPGLSAVAAERDAARADAERLAHGVLAISAEDYEAARNDPAWADFCKTADKYLAAHDNADEDTLAAYLAAHPDETDLNALGC